MEVEDIESAKLVVGAFYDANVLSVPRALIAKHLEALPSRRPDEMQRVSCESFEAFVHHAASLRVLHGQFSPRGLHRMLRISSCTFRKMRMGGVVLNRAIC